LLARPLCSSAAPAAPVDRPALAAAYAAALGRPDESTVPVSFDAAVADLQQRLDAAGAAAVASRASAAACDEVSGTVAVPQRGALGYDELQAKKAALKRLQVRLWEASGSALAELVFHSPCAFLAVAALAAAAGAAVNGSVERPVGGSEWLGAFSCTLRCGAAAAPAAAAHSRMHSE
jgi:hypothetical protein